MRRSLACAAMASVVLGWMSMPIHAQNIGYVEKFALAEDRSKALEDLIPGSEDFFFYHCLHFQNEGKLSEAEAMLNQWSTSVALGPLFQQMQTRQRLLNYTTKPQEALDYLRLELGLNLDHAPPQADRAKDLATELDPSLIDPKKIADQSLATDPSLGGISDLGIPSILDRNLNIDQIRIVLQRMTRLDLPGLLPLIEKELRAQDSRGWSAFPIHTQLTLDQRQKLAKSNPKLLENDVFVRQYLMRLLPSEETASNDVQERRSHLQRLEEFTSTLPSSQNSLKALVLYQRLLLDSTEEIFDRARFEKYLALPRNLGYYSREFLKAESRTPLVEFQANYAAETSLPPIGDDSVLILRYLENFLKTEETVDKFAKWLDRGYLEGVMTETKILNGIGNSSTWYAKLTPQQQKELRDRVELRFAASSQTYFKPSDAVQLKVDVKNVAKLIVRIYQLNPTNIYKKQGKSVSSDIDLDGLVANAEQTIEYSVPADRRHRELITLPQCEGRGAWVVDLLGGGLRSRALVIKGQLRSTQQLTDVGHELRIFDESGKHVPSARIEMGTRTFTPEADGGIIIPYGEQNSSQQILLVDGAAATVEMFTHLRENYTLEMGAFMDSQNLLSGAKGSIIVRPQLLCNGKPISVEALEETQLTIVTTDQDGTQSTQTVSPFVLKNDVDATHQFLVPQRLRTVTVTLSGKVMALSRNVRETLSVSQALQVNDITATPQNTDFYLLQDDQGFRIQVLGRNGEPIGRLPVTCELRLEQFQLPVVATLATNASGEIKLGKLPGVLFLQTSADGLVARTFSLSRNEADWPSRIYTTPDQAIDLPWISHAGDVSAPEWLLTELRGGQIYAELNSKVKLANNRLSISGLKTGLYSLACPRIGKWLEIRVVEGENRDGLVVGKTSSVELSASAPASVSKTEIKDGKLRIQVAGGNEQTRVHFLATTFVEDAGLTAKLRLSQANLFRQPYVTFPSFYVDSLRLDEEYQYILQRQYVTKYPGNLLSQPSLLLNPWDTASTENSKQEAATGDAPPPSPAPSAPMAMDAFSRGAMAERLEAAQSAGKSFFEFLGNSSIMLANRVPDKEGWIEIPIEGMKGFQTITAVVVNGSGIATQTIPMSASQFPTVDLRLAKSFAGEKHLSQQQRAKLVEANVKTDLGDARSTRVQTYSSLADIYRLYKTLLPVPELEKFRVITRWNQLKQEEKERTYSELACHELHLFLYMKDRPFFDKVVRPYLDDKFEAQWIDQYLLDRDPSPYRDLWQRNRLNSLERILLAERIPEARPGIQKWISDAVAAYPISPEIRTQKFLAALAGSNLDMGAQAQMLGEAVLSDKVMLGRSLNRFGAPARDEAGLSAEGGALQAKGLEMDAKEDSLSFNAPPGAGGGGRASGGATGAMRMKRGAMAPRKPLFQSLDATREWAESQYYRTRIGQQSLNIVPPGPMWNELAKAGNTQKFLSPEFHLACNTLSEALVSIALLDLPFESQGVNLAVEQGRLTLTAPSRCIVFIESIEESKVEEPAASVLVGQDIYLVSPGLASAAGVADPQKPLGGQALVRGIGYRSNVVVTNPSSVPKTFSVLMQIPQGALPLEGGKFVNSRTLRLEPYSTQQLQYSFYFPNAGEFTHYGAQASVDGLHAAAAPESKLVVLEKPEGQATDTWAYVSQWGTNDQVLEFLKSKNAQLLVLRGIAFRMQDKAFFEKCLAELDAQGIFEETLWSYAIKHNDPKRIAQFLSYRPDMIGRIGPILKSPIVDVDSWNRYDYEHFDYRPLVNARSHMLGATRVILNDRLSQQYQRLLQRIAYQPAISERDRMALTYYFLLQNRIEEALASFDKVAADKLPNQLQYDYFAAYLDFYRGRYDHAAEIAQKYAQYGVARWRDLFAQVQLQVKQRQSMIDGTPLPASDTAASNLSDPIQRLLVDARQSSQANLAADSPSLDLTTKDGKLILNHQKVDRVEVRYYLMDIELLFSRNPFVQQDGGALVAIQPNKVEIVNLGEARGKRELPLPAELANRNVLVEVASGAITQSQVLYANSMDVTLVDSYGRLQVRSGNGQPVEQAYVKVYARHQGGQVRFFKDGYTDLRGQFDYATLSTNDLDTVERFGILILHPERGALIREVAPPKR